MRATRRATARFRYRFACFAAWRGAGIALALAASALAAGRADACLTDSDCNDGLFCTTDHCILFVCARFDRDCNDFNDCTHDSCDESANVCVHEGLHLTSCEDFDLFTTAEVCCGSKCEGIPDNTVVLGDRCCVAANCASDQICVDTICVLDVSLPTPTATRTATRSRTPTRTSTPPPDSRPALTINDVAGNEGNSGFRSSVFTATLSSRIDQEVRFHFVVSDGSATAGSDYSAISGDLTLPRNTLSLALPAIAVVGDAIPEADESFFVHITGASSNVRVADATGQGTILNDDTFPFFVPGIGSLSPHDAVAHVGEPTALTLTWTSPRVWRDLSSVDVRLRNERGIALWLRFDETANTIGLIQPSDVSLGPALAPGSPAELAGESVAVVLGESTVESDGPDVPSVAITLALRFDAAAAGNTYLVDAAAIDDAGDVQDFDTVGAISVAALLPCPGDCSRNGAVEVAELVLGVSIALGGSDLSGCPDFDTDGSGTVEVGEIVAAVRAALEGCGGTGP